MSLDGLARALRGLIPDPFVIAIALTAVAFAGTAAWGAWTGAADPAGLVEAWVGGHVPADAPAGTRPLGGVWSLLTFAMQMCLILVTGYAVAGTRPVRAVLERLAAMPGDTRGGVVLVGAVAMALALVNWGLGLIGGALLAREVGRSLHARGRPVHHPLLAAAGYTGLAVWHGGLSGSAPLKVTSGASLDEVLGGALSARLDVLPLTETLLSPRNLVVTPLAVGVLLLGLVALVPRDPARMIPPPPEVRAPETAPEEQAPGPAGWLETSPVVSALVVLLVLAWAVPWALDGGFLSLSPDSMNLLFLALGLALAGGPAAYMRLARRGAAACAGIIVQFPLYGGILGILAAGGVIDALAAVLPTSAWGLSLTTFLSAGLLNVFVPSGGGQWSVQGPLVMQAAVTHGIDPGRVVMALSWGDQWTNLFQPFWALPLLGITGTRAGDLLGSTLILGVLVGGVFALGAVVG